jgi:glycosyltransferase involved in cell wall biosynthesis
MYFYLWDTVMNSIGKTAAYTICKNELKYVEKWLHYTSRFDYRVLLDTGSTDGTWEALQKAAESDPGLIIEQRTFTPWKFDVARKYNLSMVPNDVDWCLSPDLDEYFSINVLEEMEACIKEYPSVTCISCDRLDVYSKIVRVGPPKHLGTNKIHKRHDYTWSQPIYEHLSWIHKDRSEVEIYREELYLVHDQDFKKKERPELYLKMLTDEWRENPTNDWVLWYLCDHYYREKNMEMFIEVGCDFVKCAREKNKLADVLRELKNIHDYADISGDMREKIRVILS